MAKKEKKAKGGKKAKKAEAPEKYPADYQPRLVKRYIDSVVPALREKFQYQNTMMIPRLKKVVVNVGLGEAVQNSKLIDSAVEDLRLITGQQPVVRRARKSIAGFKLREGMPIGVKVTLRRNRMWEFVDRFMNVALPRVRDFKGVSPKGFDGSGNYTLGIREQIIFPEIDYDNIDSIRGMDITITTTARNAEEGKALLEAFNFPFKK